LSTPFLADVWNSVDKTYAKRQRQPLETPAGERAFKIAAREAAAGSGSRGKATPRRGKGAVYQEEGDLVLQHMLKIMGGWKGRPSPLSLKMTCGLGD
jgi:hypothetical protein